MSKLLKTILNIVFILVIITSIMWGIIVSGPGILNPGNGPQFWNDGRFWGFICILVVPLTSVILLWLINRKSVNKQ